MSTFYCQNLPDQVAPGSYVEVAKLRNGTYCVACYDRTSPDFVKLSARWQGKSEGEAMLVAQLVAQRGYEWRRR